MIDTTSFVAGELAENWAMNIEDALLHCIDLADIDGDESYVFDVGTTALVQALAVHLAGGDISRSDDYIGRVCSVLYESVDSIKNPKPTLTLVR
jgi:hypothetical protein